MTALEEQFFYLLVVPAILSVICGWAVILARVPDISAVLVEWRPSSPIDSELIASRLRRAAGIVLALALVWCGVVWVQVHSVPDDEYSQMATYVAANVPAGVTIGVDDSVVGPFLLVGHPTVSIDAPSSVPKTGVHYVVLSTKLETTGYRTSGESTEAWMATHGHVVTTFSGRSYGDLQLWAVDSWAP